MQSYVQNFAQIHVNIKSMASQTINFKATWHRQTQEKVQLYCTCNGDIIYSNVCAESLKNGKNKAALETSFIVLWLIINFFQTFWWQWQACALIHKCTYWSNNIRDMRNSCSWCSTEIQHFRTRYDVNLVDSSKNGRSKFGSKWIPYSVFNLLTLGCTLQHQRHENVF